MHTQIILKLLNY